MCLAFLSTISNTFDLVPQTGIIQVTFWLRCSGPQRVSMLAIFAKSSVVRWPLSFQSRIENTGMSTAESRLVRASEELDSDKIGQLVDGPLAENGLLSWRAA